MEASIAPSIRWKATRLPPESATATFIFQFRFLASATAAWITAWARSSDIGGPYGVSKGILSGTKSRGFVSVGSSARLALAALPVFSFDTHPPSVVTVCLYARVPENEVRTCEFFKPEAGFAPGVPKCLVRCEHHQYLHDPPPLSCCAAFPMTRADEEL